MKKGISPLIASVLLIAMAVSLSVIVGGWASETVRDRTEEISEQTKTQIDCSFATLYLKDFSINTTSGVTTIQLKNINQQSLSVNKVSILNTTGSLFVLNIEDVSGNTPINLSAGQIVTVYNTSSDVTGFDSLEKIDKIYVSDLSCPDARDEYEPESSDFLS